jgi:undecaprenyl-diphosphatase
MSLFSLKSDGLRGMRGLMLLALTTFPALITGAAAHGFIKKNLFNSWTVAVGLGIGGFAILLVERFLPRIKKSGLDSLGWKDALYIGLFQCLAIWPGISRSASTILGSMSIGIDRKTSAEYSFLAAVPVMFAAVSYDLYKNISSLQLSDIPVFVVGFIVSFISASLAVKFFIRLVGTHTLVPFGWYRIAVACVILFLIK